MAASPACLAASPRKANVCADTQPSGYTGAMVLPPGSASPVDCVPEFPGDGSRSYLTYDLIPMDPAALTPKPKGGASVEACQALCRAADGAREGCQYFVFLGYEDKAANRCLLRLGGVAPADLSPDNQDPKVLFEISDSKYVAYRGDAADWKSLGRDIAAHASLDAARGACDATSACVGIKYNSKGGDKPWKTFGGALWEGVTGKVRTAGPAITPWVVRAPAAAAARQSTSKPQQHGRA